MIQISNEPMVRLKNGAYIPVKSYEGDMEAARGNTLSARILDAHNTSGNPHELRLKFDLLASPDDNYSSILQEVRAMECKGFQLPWYFSNCHNALACTGGTINNDDHVFGFDCVKKYGGIYLPPYSAVIHQYMRENVAASGQLILASDSHTRYGCLGAMGIGEGGTEVARQAIGGTYNIRRPQVIAVFLKGEIKPGIGPMDLALAFIGATFGNGFCKNKILEIMGPGIEKLSMDFRFGFDAMTTEAACLSTVWVTDQSVKQWFSAHGRPQDYRELRHDKDALYDGLIEIDLGEIESMIALPFHPSNVFTIHSLSDNESFLEDVLESVEKDAAVRSGGLRFTLRDKIQNHRLTVQQAVVGGCVGGTYENLWALKEILGDYIIPADGVPLGVYPASQAVLSEAEQQGVLGALIRTGITIHPCICGPCFGSTDIPSNNTISVRHVSRNYYSREGSRPDQGQLSASALMDARSIAATVRRGGRLTAAEEVLTAGMENSTGNVDYGFDDSYYHTAVYNGFGCPKPDTDVRMGPNIADWPQLPFMNEHILLKVAGSYAGSTTTDELCPSGEASSLRSNPDRIAEYTLISKDKGYVQRAKAFRDNPRDNGEINTIIRHICERFGVASQAIGSGSVLCSDSIGDGSSREQAASNQKILGGWANLAMEYSTKRYRSNCINWGLIPLQTERKLDLKEGEYLFLANVRSLILSGATGLQAYIPAEDRMITLSIGDMTDDERKILVAGSMINYYRK